MRKLGLIVLSLLVACSFVYAGGSSETTGVTVTTAAPAATTTETTTSTATTTAHGTFSAKPRWPSTEKFRKDMSKRDVARAVRARSIR